MCVYICVPKKQWVFFQASACCLDVQVLDHCPVMAVALPPQGVPRYRIFDMNVPNQPCTCTLYAGCCCCMLIVGT